jgi:hypothetical protein
MGARAWLILGLVGVGLLLGVDWHTFTLGAPASAQAANKAAIVVRFADGSSQARCVDFAESQLTGLQLLQRAGYPVVLAQVVGQGAAVCKIGADGCDPNSCLVCQPPKYWSYWHLDGGQWRYSNVGAATYAVKPGTVEGWAWPGNVTPAVKTFAEVCSPAASATATPIPPTATTAPIVAPPTATSPAAPPTATLTTAPPTATPTRPASQAVAAASNTTAPTATAPVAVPPTPTATATVAVPPTPTSPVPPAAPVTALNPPAPAGAAPASVPAAAVASPTPPLAPRPGPAATGSVPTTPPPQPSPTPPLATPTPLATAPPAEAVGRPTPMAVEVAMAPPARPSPTQLLLQVRVGPSATPSRPVPAATPLGGASEAPASRLGFGHVVFAGIGIGLVGWLGLSLVRVR